MYTRSAMEFMRAEERALAQALSDLAVANPFLPERIEAERRALGPDFVAIGPVWHARPAPRDINPNVPRLGERAQALADTLRERLAAGARPAAAERGLYEDVVLYALYHRMDPALQQVIQAEPGARLAGYPRFVEDLRRYLGTRPGGAELTRRYRALVYARTRTYVETARRLGIDRRTVKERVARDAPRTGG
jgi:hypothetical protein